MWISFLVSHDNAFTPVEQLVKSAFTQDLLTGEDLARTRVHVSSQLSENWEVFGVKSERGVKYVRLRKHVRREACVMPQADPDAPVLPYRDAPGIASATLDTAMDPNEVVVVPESVESISTKSIQEPVPKLRLHDERNTTPVQFCAGLRQCRGKH